MGLLEITMEPSEEPMISAEENAKTRNFVKARWMLGPEKTQQPNSDYWRKLSVVWRTDPGQAKRQLCANCEYFDDSPEMLEKMESIPQDEYDKDGGGRGWCSKFNFICHTLRTCQAWEKCESKEED